jgi:hypothetical protein
MKRVGVREFRDHATHYLASGEVLAVERHGKPIGFFIPVPAASAEEARLALERLSRAVAQALAASDLDEDELSRALDLRRHA